MGFITDTALDQALDNVCDGVETLYICVAEPTTFAQASNTFKLGKYVRRRMLGKMKYDARCIANWFVERAQREGRGLSIMSLLKLTYIAHGWHLEIRKQPLFHNRVEAWQYGPVIPDVYSAFRGQGVNVQRKVDCAQSLIAQEDQLFLDEVWSIYGGMSPFNLSDLTHEVGGPWDIASKSGGNYAIIPNELIRNHYELKRLKGNQRQHS